MVRWNKACWGGHQKQQTCVQRTLRTQLRGSCLKNLITCNTFCDPPCQMSKAVKTSLTTQTDKTAIGWPPQLSSKHLSISENQTTLQYLTNNLSAQQHIGLPTLIDGQTNPLSLHRLWCPVTTAIGVLFDYFRRSICSAYHSQPWNHIFLPLTKN